MGRDEGRHGTGGDGPVSIHAPAWGATKVVDTVADTVQFQSTRPHGARPVMATAPSGNTWFQSTRPHGARQGQEVLGDTGLAVSIHAPAWGATLNSIRNVPRSLCFNPRARMGRDGTNGYIYNSNARFNPRARMGRDPVCVSGSFGPAVSIHAPAWGATRGWSWRRAGLTPFQSTRPHGARRTPAGPVSGHT